MLTVDWKSFKKKGLKQPKNQFPTGTRAYKGFQGRGKTLSAVKYIIDLSSKYPESVVFSNVKIEGVKNFYYCKTDEDIYFGLNYANGEKGVIVFIDEAHLFFNKKTGISLDVLAQISQQRKERRKIIITSQIWEDLDISLRKQVPEIVDCRNFGNIQINKISNGESLRYDRMESAYTANCIGYEIFKRTEELAKRYETLAKIETNKDYKRDYNTSFFVTSEVLYEKQK